jgi:hypothetical protein
MSAFIPRGQLPAAPFNTLVGLGKSFRCTADLEKAWQNIRAAVSGAVATTNPRPGEELVVKSDASTVGWGGVLLARRCGSLLPVAFVSRTWKGAEARYSAVRREALALKNTVARLQMYIKGDPDVVY